MKHLSSKKPAKHHRFSYTPRFYNQDKEAFQFRVDSIKQQLNDQVAPENVQSVHTSSSALSRSQRIQRFFSLLGLFVGFIATLYFLSDSMYGVAVLFVLALAFIKISKR